MTYFVTVDGKEYEETLNPNAQCVFCENQGAYQIDENDIAFCEKCLKDNYKHVREEV